MLIYLLSVYITTIVQALLTSVPYQLCLTFFACAWTSEEPFTNRIVRILVSTHKKELVFVQPSCCMEEMETTS